MKNFLLIILFYFSAIAVTSAQDNNPGNDRGRLQAYKIAFLTKKLELSPEEAQRFWPIYNNYEADMRNARVEKRQGNDNEIEADERVLNIRKKYNTDFSKVLSADKVNTLFRSEKEFGNVVQKELQERRGRNGSSGSGNGTRNSFNR